MEWARLACHPGPKVRFADLKNGTADLPELTLAELADWYPFAAWAPAALAAVLPAATQEVVAPGPLPPARLAPRDLVYLRQGALRVQPPAEVKGGRAHWLRAGTPQARFPLPHQDGRPLLVSEPALLVRLPRALVEATAGRPASRQGAARPALRLAEQQAIKDLHAYFHAGNCELPSLPELTLRIGRAIDATDTRSADIARLIQLDPALTTRMLRVVNSAAFAARREIVGVRQAVDRLGRRRVRNLVVSCLLKGLFETDSRLLKGRMEEIWRHSTQVAALSLVLARVTPGLDPERALLAGLLQDIGAVAVLGALRNFPALTEDPQVLDYVLDAMRVEVGVMTLRCWRLDPDLIEVVVKGRRWSRIGTALADNVDVVLLAQLHAAIGTPRMAALPRIDQLPAYQKLALGQLSPRHSIALLDQAEAEVREVQQLIGGP